MFLKHLKINITTLNLFFFPKHFKYIVGAIYTYNNKKNKVIISYKKTKKFYLII